MVIRTILAAFLLSIAGIASTKPRPLEDIPLQWRPTSALQLGTTQMTVSTVTIAPFSDGRDDKAVIGENRDGDIPRPVTTTNDVGEFVSANVRKLFEQAGMKTVDSDGEVTIKGEVKQFFARETSTYKSTVVIHLTVVDQNGKSLWNGLGSGEATRFGRSYSAENYYEVLSDAVVNTVSSMLQDADFRKALSGHAVGLPP